MSSHRSTTSSRTTSRKHSTTTKLTSTKKHTRNKIDEFSLEYVNEDHIEAFANALAEDPEQDTTEHIAAVTDFMPIRQKVKKKKPKVPNGFDGISYHIVRFPLMLFIFTIITFELICYVLVRQIVNIWEYFVQWRGERYLLREQLRNSTTYKEWKEAAKQLDSYFHYNEWKDEIPFGYYDFNLLQKVNRDLKKTRESPSSDSHSLLKNVLQNCVKNNFAGVENVRLYSQTYYGTKKVVENYIDEVTESLDYLRTSKSLPLEEKRKLFRNTQKNYGRTALCLSGGACFGYYHLGVVKALFEANLLPTVITGTSAGGLIAALICVRTDDELAQVLRPELNQRLTACSESLDIWLKRWWTIGARFDAVDWARKTQWITKGSLTFREAYERTGRILNISVIPYDPHSPPKVLNYITAPDCVIWSAVIASAAVPGILNPVVLMQKLKNGTIVPYNYGHKWKDGSLRTDIPIQSLHMHFNVKNTIVSQVNPHIHLFFYAPRGSVGRPVSHRHGRGWRGGFLLSGIEQYLKLDLSKWLKWIRDLELLPKVADQDWSMIWLQKFEGNITIWPKSKISDFFYILSDPDYERLDRMITTGQRVTWPKLHMISNRLKIERAIQKGKDHVKREQKRKLRHQRNNDETNDIHIGHGRTMSSPSIVQSLVNINNSGGSSSSDYFDHSSSGQEESDEMILTNGNVNDSDSDSSNSEIFSGSNTSNIGSNDDDDLNILKYDMVTSQSSSSSEDDGILTPDDGQDLL
ncbi:acyl transferase/acyl hydrolase/lysophospholipase [Glomus cerebriforme]|uniref:Patatin-like phospholipase domain-containing protein n=1 Tax=Glomus cerebriforme TaxID=658196 RepID=A0A397T4H7_9GLOM|nr:acyl transferase/acyl hydrolase/lysophospholipase [Glomus cerebriforme]